MRWAWPCCAACSGCRSGPTTTRTATTTATAGGGTTGPVQRTPAAPAMAGCRCPMRSRVQCGFESRVALPTRFRSRSDGARKSRHGCRRGIRHQASGTGRTLGLMPDAFPGSAPRRAVLHSVVVDLLHVGVRGLVGAVDPDQALLVEGGIRLRVAAIPARADAELLERPVDRAAQPRLFGEDVQVVLDEVLLEPVRALLLRGPVAVGLGTELGHDDRLVRVARVDAVEEG